MDKYAYLLFVDEFKNHNKFYEMKMNGDGSIDVKYGRVGNPGVSKHYSSYEKNFIDLYYEKINKGYQDVTALHATKEAKGGDYSIYKPLDDKCIDKVFSFLYESSRQFFKKNYTIDIQEVTEKMITEAEEDLKKLSRCAEENLSLYEFNSTLKQLFTDIPRKMNKVSDYLAADSSDFTKIIEREIGMLNNIKGQHAQSKTAPPQDASKTISEAYGVTMERTTYAEEDKIIAGLGKDYGGGSLEERFVTCYKVSNKKTEAAFDRFCKDFKIAPDTIRHFYHGSKVENWLSIASAGLLLNPDASTTGKMFGQGLYFAGEDELRKSLNYMDVKGSVWNNGTRDTGFTAIFKVALGKCYKPHGGTGPSFNYKDLRDGCTSVYADRNLTGLRNDEYIVYRQEQCTIEYLMEMRADAKPLHFSFPRHRVRNHIAKGFSSLVKIPEGIRAEFDVLAVNQKCSDELSKFIDFAEYSKVFFDYNARTDRLSFSAINNTGDSIEIFPRLTNDDKAFLLREMKKSFVKSEPAWEKLVDKASKERTGKEFFNIEKNKHERA